MSRHHADELSRRERQIVDALFRLGEAPVAAVREALEDPPSYSAVRTTMGILVDKGWLSYRKDGRHYLYRTTVPRGSARRRALRHVVQTFFGGKPEDAVAALLDLRKGALDEGTLERLARRIEEARKQT